MILAVEYSFFSEKNLQSSTKIQNFKQKIVSLGVFQTMFYIHKFFHILDTD
jgi:hypothetical protein